MSFKLSVAALAAIALHCTGAYAAEAEPSMFSFSGYGTLGTVHSSESHADVTATNFQPNGAGYTRRWSEDVDSRLAGQISAAFDNHWSAVVQLVAEQRWDNSYRPVVEWANVRYAVTPDFSVRLGRIALPTFLMSNTRKVGYTMPWVRMPSVVYNSLALTNNDGADLSYAFQAGKVRDTVVVYAGRNNSTYSNWGGGGYREEARHMRGVANTLSYGAATLLLSHFDARLTAATVGIVDASYKVNAVGASYDPGDWFVMGEWAKVTSDLSDDIPSCYVGGGVRIGDFTPYALYSRRGQTFIDLRAFATPQPSAGVGAHSIGVGLRWDVMKNTDVKLQYERSGIDADSIGIVINPHPGFRPGGKVNVVSLAVDFVF